MRLCCHLVGSRSLIIKRASKLLNQKHDFDIKFSIQKLTLVSLRAPPDGLFSTGLPANILK